MSISGAAAFAMSAILVLQQVAGAAPNPRPQINDFQAPQWRDFRPRLEEAERLNNAYRQNCDPETGAAIRASHKALVQFLQELPRHVSNDSEGTSAYARLRLINDTVRDCDPVRLRALVEEWGTACDLGPATYHLARLEWLARLRKRQADAAKALGEFGKVSHETAAKLQAETEKELRKARASFKEHEKRCAERKVSDAGDAAGAPASEGIPVAMEAQDVCAVAGDDRPESCGKWAQLLGRWTNVRYGGVVEFRLKADDTVSAFIVSASERMQEEGYEAGMEVLRGWRFGGVGRGTWAFFAEGGEAFSAVKPGRKPGEILGDPKWVTSGVIFIEKEKPGVVDIPATLEGRISDYGDWVRQGSVGPAI